MLKMQQKQHYGEKSVTELGMLGCKSNTGLVH